MDVQAPRLFRYQLTYALDDIRNLPQELERELDWSAEHYLGWVEVNGQMSDPMELLAREDYTSTGAGLPRPVAVG